MTSPGLSAAYRRLRVPDDTVSTAALGGYRGRQLLAASGQIAVATDIFGLPASV